MANRNSHIHKPMDSHPLVITIQAFNHLLYLKHLLNKGQSLHLAMEFLDQLIVKILPNNQVLINMVQLTNKLVMGRLKFQVITN